jgi:hypothetical protein
MQITLSGKLMHVTPPLNVLDRDTLPYVRLHIHTLSSLRTRISLTQVETSHFHFNENRNIFQVSRQLKIRSYRSHFTMTIRYYIQNRGQIYYVVIVCQ